jgi:hypothetical protein
MRIAVSFQSLDVMFKSQILSILRLATTYSFDGKLARKIKIVIDRAYQQRRTLGMIRVEIRNDKVRR